MQLKRLHKVALLAAALTLYGILCPHAQAQSWPQRWNDEGEADDIGECIAQDKRGNVIVAGSTKNWNSTWDVQVLKYSATGTFLWEKHYNGGGDDYAAAIHVDDDLNVYVAGTSYGGSTTSYDFFVWKLDTDGIRVWPTSGSGTGWAMDSLGAIRTTSSGNEGFSEGLHVDMDVRVAASPANRNIAVTGTATTSGLGGTYWRTVVFEQNSAGTTVAIKSGWPRDSSFSAQTPDIPEGVAIGSDNTVYVTGKTANPKGEEETQTAYFTTIRYNASGTDEIWTHYWDSSKQSHGMDIVLDRDGNAYATGFLGIATDIDYGTVRIPKDWDDENYSDTGLKTARWDNNERIDKAVSIDLTYEVESGVLKPYIYVTGTTTEVAETADIATIRYSPHTGNQSLTEVWDDIYGGSNGDDEVGLMVVGTGNGNAYVIGRQDTDYVLLGYRKSGTKRFSVETYNGSGDDFDEGRALAMAGAGHVRATGQSTGSGGTLLDFATVEHAQDVTSGGPSDDLVQLGTETGGGMSDLLVSDSNYRVYTRTIDDVDSPEKLIVEFNAYSPISSGSNPSELCIRYEGKCSVSNVMLKIELYNWVTTSYDVIDYRRATTSDAKLVFVIKEDPDVYILGSDPEIKVRLSWDATLGGETYDWTASINQLRFELIGT